MTPNVMPTTLQGLVLAAALAASVTAAPAQERRYDLRLSSWVPPGHGMNPALRQWGESIATASNGTIKVTLFPAEQLGPAESHYDMARGGIAELTFISMSHQPGRLPIAEGGNLLFLYRDAYTGSRAYDAWYRKYAPAEMKDVKLCFAFIHDPGTIFSNKEIRRPEDLKGMKIRSANAQTADFVGDVGGVSVRVSAPEARAALESGIAEAIMLPWKSAIVFGIDKVIAHSIDLNLYAGTFAILMHKATFDRMSPRQKTVMDEHCSNPWAGVIGKTWGDHEAAGRAELKAKAGHRHYVPSTVELEAWKAAGEPARKRWSDAARKAGIDPDAALKELDDGIRQAEGRP